MSELQSSARDSGIPGKIMNVSSERFKVANDHRRDSFMISFITDLQTCVLLFTFAGSS